MQRNDTGKREFNIPYQQDMNKYFPQEEMNALVKDVMNLCASRQADKQFEVVDVQLMAVHALAISLGLMVSKYPLKQRALIMMSAGLMVSAAMDNNDPDEKASLQ